MTLSIDQFKPGDKAKITGFKACDASYRRQLMALGLTPGTVFDIIRIAPMGDPVQIQVRQACLALRKQEAAILRLEHV
jgi:ferrous iron transport protein A